MGIAGRDFCTGRGKGFYLTGEDGFAGRGEYSQVREEKKGEARMLLERIGRAQRLGKWTRLQFKKKGEGKRV